MSGLYGEKDEIFSPTVSECIKLIQVEYKTWYDLVGKVILGESWKKQKFDETSKLYMHKIDSVLENETHTIRSAD